MRKCDKPLSIKLCRHVTNYVELKRSHVGLNTFVNSHTKRHDYEVKIVKIVFLVDLLHKLKKYIHNIPFDLIIVLILYL